MADSMISGLGLVGTLATDSMVPIQRNGASVAERATMTQVAGVVKGALSLPGLDVTSYGAVGDGITDDSAAFTAAIAAAQASGGVVVARYSPSGYSLKNIDVPSGVTLDMQGSKIWPASGASYAVNVSGYASNFLNWQLDDNAGNTVRATTRASGGASGATTIVVNSALDLAANQVVAIELADGLWHLTFITAVAGSTLTFRDALPAAAASGGRVWATYGAVRVTGSWCRVSDWHIVNGWGGIIVDAAGADVSKNSISNGSIDTCKIFGVFKGRNASLCSFSNIKALGGWTATLTGTANGSNTDWTSPDNIWLRRDAAVTVGGVTKTYGTDYTVVADASGRYRIVRFGTAPASGATVVATAFTQGVAGLFVDGGYTVGSTGGNHFSGCDFLGWQDGVYLKRAQLYLFTDLVSDTNSRSDITLDGTTYLGDIYSAFLGWAPQLVRAINNATGCYVHTSSTNTLPASTSIDGAAGIVGNVASGSGVGWRQAGWTGNTTAVSDWTIAGDVYFNPSVAYQESGSAGSPSLAYKADPTTGFYRISAGAVGYSSAGAVAVAFASTGISTIAGTAAAPSISPGYSSGLWASSAALNVSVNGSNVASFTSAGMNLVTLPNYANDTAAAAGGVVVGQLYRNGSVVMQRVS